MAKSNANDIVVVGIGAVLPEAKNYREYSDNLFAEKSAVRSLVTKERIFGKIKHELVYSEKPEAGDDTSDSLLGAFVDHRLLLGIAKEHAIDLKENSLLDVMVFEAVRQALSENKLRSLCKEKTDLVFGHCNTYGDISSYLQDSYNLIRPELQERMDDSKALLKLLEEEIQRAGPLRERNSFINSFHLKWIQERFEIQGNSFLIDSACASSLAAAKIAMLRIQSGLCDFALFGGMNDLLAGLELTISFSRLGVLSKNGTRPFDKDGDGLSVGDGAVAFVVTSRERAERNKLPIKGVIQNIGGSSDGKSGGITEPTVSGQVASYQLAYQSDTAPKLTYLECHGSGTGIGDRVELESVAKYFGDQNLTLGSSKFNVGHTMGAAGACGLLKGLAILDRKEIPPNRYFTAFPSMDTGGLRINRELVSIPDSSSGLDIGVSAFGFGGTNFHLWLQSEHAEHGISNSKKMPNEKIVLIGETFLSLANIKEAKEKTKFRFPPTTVGFADPVQFLSVFAVEKLLADLGIREESLDWQNMHVIAGSPQPLEYKMQNMTKRLYTRYLMKLLRDEMPSLSSDLSEIETRLVNRYPEYNEFAFVGIMNNLVASRVSKAFDAKGINLVVDGDGANGLIALEVARNILWEAGGGAIVLESVCEQNPTDKHLQTIGMKARLLCSEAWAQDHSLPIASLLQPLKVGG